MEAGLKAGRKTSARSDAASPAYYNSISGGGNGGIRMVIISALIALVAWTLSAWFAIISSFFKKSGLITILSGRRIILPGCFYGNNQSKNEKHFCDFPLFTSAKPVNSSVLGAPIP